MLFEIKMSKNRIVQVNRSFHMEHSFTKCAHGITRCVPARLALLIKMSKREKLIKRVREAVSPLKGWGRY